jgi:hypothetical protein
VAFAGGGDVERYQSRGLVEDVSGMGGSEIMAAAGTELPYSGRNLLERLVFAPEEPEWKKKLRQEEALRKRNPAAPSSPTAEAPVAPVAAEAVAPSAPSAPAAPAPRPSNMERAEALSSPTTIDALQQKYFGGYKDTQANINAKREGLVKGIKDLAVANLEEDKKYAEERSSDKVYKGREERLAKQEKDLEGLDDRYLGLAMLQAGAAMMSTPGGIGAALGKGVSVGAERYAAGLDKINAAQAKFAEARDRLDELRINRDDMNAKQIRDSLRQVQASDLRGQEFLLNGLVTDWGIEREMLGKVFTAAADDVQTTRRIAAQKATAGKQDTNEQMKAALFADLKNKYPDDPARVATEFNKAIAKASADPTALYRQELAKQLAEEKVKLAKIGNVEMKGQKEKIQALEKELFGGGSEAATPLPANASEKTLVVGTTYQTAKGPAKWTGKEFMPI